MAKNYSSTTDSVNGIRRECSREKLRNLIVKYMESKQHDSKNNIRRESSYHKKLSSNIARIYNC